MTFSLSSQFVPSVIPNTVLAEGHYYEYHLKHRARAFSEGVKLLYCQHFSRMTGVTEMGLKDRLHALF